MSFNNNLQLQKRALKSAQQYFSGIVKGDRFVLSEAITLIESTLLHKRKLAGQIADLCHEYNSRLTTTRLAITGSPGAGKSTFINAFGMYLISKGHKVAVLAIDPTSNKSHGSILGDKTRMESLSTHENAYIRPTAAGQLLGGVAFGTKESIPLCETAGYDYIIVETVGVGQSEFMASDMCDMTLLLIQPGAGDDVQGIKKGIVEMADIVIVTKADGVQKDLAMMSKRYYDEALHYASNNEDDHFCEVMICSAIEKIGFEEILNAIDNQMNRLRGSNLLGVKRAEQESKWFITLLKENTFSLLLQNKLFLDIFEKLKSKINLGNISTHSAIIKLEEEIKYILNK